MQKTLISSLLLACVLTACDVEKPPSPETTSEIGKVPKQIMDKAKNQLNQAEQLNVERAQALENIDGLGDKTE